MNDEQKSVTSTPSADTDLTGDEALDSRLAKPVFEGYSGLDKAQIAISAFLIVLIGAIVFSMSLGVPFHHEDQQRIVNNPALHSIWTINNGWDPYIVRPIVALTFAIDWTIGDGSPLPFHAVNLVIHFLNAILVYLLARRLLRHEAPEPAAMSAGLLFLVHPIVTESVNYITYRSTLLVTLFTLASVVLYLRATDREAIMPRMPSLTLSLIAFLLAWASSVTAWILPPLLLACDHAAGNHRDWRARIGATAPYWLLLALLILTHASSGVAADSFLAPDGLLRQAAAFDVQSLVPAGLGVVHESVSPGVRPYLWLMLFIVALAVLRFVPILGVAMLWYALGTVAPGLYDPQPMVREHYLYLPFAGIVLIVPWILESVPQPNTRLATGIGAAIVIVALGSFTFLRNTTWQSEEDLWLDARGECPTCFEPANRLGAIRIAEGEAALQRSQQAAASAYLGAPSALPAELERERERATTAFARAEEVLLDALEIDPETNAEAWLNLGTAQRYLNKLDQARAALERAMLLDPQNFRTTFQLALLTEARAFQNGSPQDRQRASEYYARAARLGPLPQEALERYGLLVAQGSDPVHAASVLRQAALGNPNSPAAQALADLQQREYRIRDLQTRVQAIAANDPADTAAVALSAEQLFLQRNFLQAAYLIESIFRQSPPTLNLWLLLGANKAAMNSFDRFLLDWPDPPPAEGPNPWYELAKRIAENGQWDAALRAVERIPEAVRGERPLFTLARIAQELNNPQNASTALHKAAAEAPADPEPWIRLANLALDLGQPAAVSRFLAEAETRNGSREILDAIRQRAGVTDDQPVRRFIRPN